MSTEYVPQKEVQNVILSILLSHIGEDKRIRRKVLLNETNHLLYRRHLNTNDPRTILSDRTLRKSIEWLRCNHKRGAMICSSYLKGSGYFLAKDKAELEKHLGADLKRSITIYRRAQKQLSAAGIAESPQISLF